ACETEEDQPFWRREKVTVNAAYGNERLPIHLLLPHDAKPPYQTVVYFPGSGAITKTSSRALSTVTFRFLVRHGRAVIYPVYKGTHERGEGHPSDMPDETVFFKDWVVHMAKDLFRTVDYLETREDIDTGRLAYYGFSWGGERGALLLALEPRFKVAVFLSGGLTPARSLPEVDPIHFAPRVETPVLMLNGVYDYFFPVEAGQKPLFDRLGTPAEHKRHVVYPGSGHALLQGPSRNRVMGEILAWLERYLR
ncbi:MAG: alpha/beta hydrolase family protein, partial [Planctomycetota bacterium]